MFLLATIVCLAPPQPQDLEVELRDAAAALAELGVEVDVDTIDVQVLGPARMRAVELRQIEAWRETAHGRVYAFLDEVLTPTRERDPDRGWPFPRYGGFWLTRERRIAVARGWEKSPEGGRWLVAHELVHAWQDALPERSGPPASLERFLIDRCLGEGQAEILAGATIEGGLEAAFERPFGFRTKVDSNEDQVQYIVGRRFLMDRFLEDGWPGVLGVFSATPASTEQLLHPEKHRRDDPVAIAMPDAPEGFRILAETIVGELGLRTLVFEATGWPPIAIGASTGWDGDRLQILQTADGATAAWWRIVWDRPKDAQQFEEVALRILPGTVCTHGRVSDWVLAADAESRQRLQELLEALEDPGEAPTGDSLTTALAESRTLAAPDRPLFDFYPFDREDR